MNEEASTTSSGSPPETAEAPKNEQSGAPRFPAPSAGRPLRRRMSASSVTTEDFPFVPVTATSRSAGSPSARKPSSSSENTGTPAERAAARIGVEGGIPGEATTRSQPSSSPGGWPPQRTETPTSRSAAAASATSDSGRASAAVTSRPRAARHRAAAVPETPRPSASAVRPGTRGERDAPIAHRIFSVVRVASAQSTARIQNRTVT